MSDQPDMSFLDKVLDQVDFSNLANFSLKIHTGSEEPTEIMLTQGHTIP